MQNPESVNQFFPALRRRSLHTSKDRSVVLKVDLTKPFLEDTIVPCSCSVACGDAAAERPGSGVEYVTFGGVSILKLSKHC